MQPKPNIEEPVCIPRDIALQAAMIRLGNIDEEIQAGYNIIRKYHKTVTVFGSARTSVDDPYYQLAEEISTRLAGAGYAIVSGGGNGIMGAANQGAHIAAQKGASKVGGESIGFNIKLPHEQTLNSYTTINYEFAHFAPRKIVMTMYADAYIYFPGGFGTLDELTEILTLIQTGKTLRSPIILVGRDFWSDFDAFVKKQLLRRGLISTGDEDLYTITDNPAKVVELVKSNTTYCDHRYAKAPVTQ
jgi:uncharacterized protein (TIGR00730 family)